MLVYLVPGAHEAIARGRRCYNWVWYRNANEALRAEMLQDSDGRQRTSSVPPGLLSARAEADLRAAAARDLPPPFRMLVDATQEPFLQSCSIFTALGAPVPMSCQTRSKIPCCSASTW